MSLPKIGDSAPDVTFTTADREKVSVSDLKGKENLVIAFYVMAFTGG